MRAGAIAAPPQLTGARLTLGFGAAARGPGFGPQAGVVACARGVKPVASAGFSHACVVWLSARVGLTQVACGSAPGKKRSLPARGLRRCPSLPHAACFRHAGSPASGSCGGPPPALSFLPGLRQVMGPQQFVQGGRAKKPARRLTQTLGAIEQSGLRRCIALARYQFVRHASAGFLRACSHMPRRRGLAFGSLRAGVVVASLQVLGARLTPRPGAVARGLVSEPQAGVAACARGVKPVASVGCSHACVARLHGRGCFSQVACGAAPGKAHVL